MICSMTGYGSAQCAEDGVSYALEIRTVNNRYLKLTLKLPEPLQFAESAVDKLVRSRIARGSVDYAIRIRSEEPVLPYTVHLHRMQQYIDMLVQARVPAGTQPTVDLASLALLPGVCEEAEADERDRPKKSAIVERLTREALDALTSMRRGEGEALKQDLIQTCNAIREKLTRIATRAPLVVDEYHARLKSRVTMLMQAGGYELDAEGLMREVAVFAERCDISEELSRLTSHLTQFMELCERGEQVGRTLDFLTQELLREANTIASKSNNAQITRNVVEIKGLIDRLREQVQNVE